MKTMIEGFRIFPGDHCGSVAMRGLLNFYCGLELPEPAVFGLGAGLDCMYLSGAGMDPSVTVFGRTGSLEVDVGVALGVDYREQPEADDDHAWELVRDEVLAGRPTMLSGDILYLDYREFKVHFPAHRFVLVGFDDEAQKAFIADRVRDEPEACSYGAVRQSRNPPEGLSTHNLWGRFHGTEVGSSLTDATRSAIDRCSSRMLGSSEDRSDNVDFGEGAGVTRGIEAIRRLARELPSWASREDAQWVASFNSRCIEKFGNGGGNFRRLYAGFLAWARDLDPKLVPEEAPELGARAADGWTAIAGALGTASEEGASSASWKQAADLASEVADVEHELFSRLADRAA
jgi:hypothetical protein